MANGSGTKVKTVTLYSVEGEKSTVIETCLTPYVGEYHFFPSGNRKVIQRGGDEAEAMEAVKRWQEARAREVKFYRDLLEREGRTIFSWYTDDDIIREGDQEYMRIQRMEEAVTVQ